MATSAVKLLIFMVGVGALIAAGLFFLPNRQDRLGVHLAGYTNHFRGMGREVIVALTNHSDTTFTVMVMSERKKPEWQTRATPPPFMLSGHSATNYPVWLQPNNGTWRVRVLYRSPVTKWQVIRQSWSLKLEARKWRLLAAFIDPKIDKVVLTPEMEL